MSEIGTALEIAGDPLLEVLADMENPLWRINNLYWVIDDKGKEGKFRMRPEQEDYLINLWYKNCCLKSRQHGMTTFITLLQLDGCIFNQNYQALTIHETLDKAKEIFRLKAKYPWDKLPDSVKDGARLIGQDLTSFTWEHGSRLSMGISGRGGTLQSLHVSELGPIAAHNPAKAKEIVIGSFEAVVLDGGVIHVESTGMGQAGEFYDMVDTINKRVGPETIMDFRLHFYPWWKKTANVLDPKGVLIEPEMVRYFKRLFDEHGIQLRPEQKAWYVKKRESIDDDIRSEHPSYPGEAFEVVIKGAIVGKEMQILRKMGRIGSYPYNPRLPVNTFWDFGVDDSTSIWLHQRIRGMNRYIGYFSDSGEGLGYYVNEINQYGFTWGTHFIPHDGDTRRLGIKVTTYKKDLQKLGLGKIKTVPRIQNKELGVQQLRTHLLTCEFDAQGTIEGVKCLDNYQREWDEKLKRWKSDILHNWASHGADAIMQAAQGYDPDEDRPAPQIANVRPVIDAETGH